MGYKLQQMDGRYDADWALLAIIMSLLLIAGVFKEGGLQLLHVRAPGIAAAVNNTFRAS